MRWGSLCLLAGATMVGGCSGRLQFDPRVDAGQGTYPAVQPMVPTPSRLDARAPDAPRAPEREPTAVGPDVAPPPPDALPPADGRATDDATDPDTMPAVAACPPGTDVLVEVFKKNCGSCHGAAAPAQSLDLVSMGLGARMVNKPSTCSNRPLIDGMLEGENPTGLLFDKLSGSVTNCGVQMPAGAPALTPTEMACVKDWAVAAINKALGR
jgi:hypothetical protein